MNSPEYSGSEPQKLPAQIGNVAAVDLHEVDGEPRAKDTEIAKRLGFDRPRAIRQTIERHRIELERFGPLATRRGASRGQEFDEFWLNEAQALYIGAKSDAPNAPAVLTMLINVFIAWRHGHLPESPKAAAVSATMREARMIFHEGQRMAKIAGLRGNQAVLAGQQMTVKLTGIDPLEMIGATFLAAPIPEVLLNATDVGAKLGDLKAQHVNAALIRHGYQTSFRGTKGAIHYEPTEKGRAAGGEMVDTGKKQGGVPVNQLRWRSGIVALLRADLDGEGA